MAETYASVCNDTVRPVLETSLKSVLKSSMLNVQVPASSDLVLAIAICMQEACGGHPRVYVNAAVSTADPCVPSIFIFTDKSFAWSGVFVSDGFILYPQMGATAVGVICNWLHSSSAHKCGDRVADLANFVLRGESNAFAALAQ
jgi:hypothetical protein